MSESEGLDLSKVVNLIMENPHLIEEISKLASSSGTKEEPDAQKKEETEEITTVATTPATYKGTDARGRRRSELLCAIKPYLSDERAKAIDTMITIADIIGMMGRR